MWSSFSGREPCSLSTAPSHYLSSSKVASSCRPSSSIRATSMGPRGFALWGCWTRNTTIGRRSSETGMSAAMPTQTVKGLFANDINRRIEEVIKVDQTGEEIVRDEINEYVVTDSIRSQYTKIYDAYRETPNKPHEGIAIWVSGFFGSGKSSFAKMLGLSIANRAIAGESAADRFAQRTGDKKLQVLL